MHEIQQLPKICFLGCLRLFPWNKLHFLSVVFPPLNYHRDMGFMCSIDQECSRVGLTRVFSAHSGKDAIEGQLSLH